MAVKKLIPVHPGEILLKEFIDAMGVSQSCLARDLGVPVPRIHEIVYRRRSITPEMALRLARYFGTSPESWLNLQQAYDLRVVRRECEAEIRKTVQPAKT
jgi:addiction module HigA family antidote